MLTYKMLDVMAPPDSASKGTLLGLYIHYRCGCRRIPESLLRHFLPQANRAGRALTVEASSDVLRLSICSHHEARWLYGLLEYPGPLISRSIGSTGS